MLGDARACCKALTGVLMRDSAPLITSLRPWRILVKMPICMSWG